MAKKENTPKEEPKKAPVKRDMRNIIRIAGKDLNGDYPIQRALLDVKGVGFTLSRAMTKKITEKLSIEPETKLSSLDEEQLKALTDIVTSPQKYGIPSYLLNRRKSRETGEDVHLTGHDLDFKVQEDKGLEKKIASYKGIRHQLGLTVRGQRTRTSGRKGGTVGVQKTAKMKKAQKR
ncbi:30S ribosomal protein S13 [archaeon]|nr:30S ribosomal protein S13 [archaeon]